MDGVILFSVFFISAFLGALTVRGIETLIERKKANKRYLRRLETENQRLKRAVVFYELELQTREV
jgi:hypothetical protein